MKRIIICVLSAFLMLGCKSTSYIDKSVSDGKKSANTEALTQLNTNIEETDDTETTTETTTTEFVKDTVDGSNRVAKVTTTKQTTTRSKKRTDLSQVRDSVRIVEAEELHVKSDVAEESKAEAGNYWRFFLFGLATGVLLVILVKLAWKYLKSQLSFGLWR